MGTPSVAPANSAGLLIAARAVQGVGGAIASPAALSLVTAVFPEGKSRNRALATYAGATGGGGVLGLAIVVRVRSGEINPSHVH